MDITKWKEELAAQMTELVREDAKNTAVAWLQGTALPAAQEIAATYIAALRESAKTESGWVKFRDAFFLPGAVELGLWLAKTALGKMAAKGASC